MLGSLLRPRTFAWLEVCGEELCPDAAAALRSLPRIFRSMSLRLKLLTKAVRTSSVTSCSPQKHMAECVHSRSSRHDVVLGPGSKSGDAASMPECTESHMVLLPYAPALTATSIPRAQIVSCTCATASLLVVREQWRSPQAPSHLEAPQQMMKDLREHLAHVHHHARPRASQQGSREHAH